MSEAIVKQNLKLKAKHGPKPTVNLVLYTVLCLGEETKIISLGGKREWTKNVCGD